MKIKTLTFLIAILTPLYAPYEVQFYIRRSRNSKPYQFNVKKKNRFLKVKKCVKDTFHVQPERLSEETPKGETTV